MEKRFEGIIEGEET